MKTGLILYVLGDDRAFDMKDLLRIGSQKVSADRVEIVSRHAGHFDISDAWWALTTKGMQRIVCNIAEIDSKGALSLSGRDMRLCG